MFMRFFCEFVVHPATGTIHFLTDLYPPHFYPRKFHFQANTSKTVEELDSQLNLSKDEIAASESRHLVFGAPYLGLEKEVVCQLAQTEYITGHNHRTHLASWVAFTLKGEVGAVLQIKKTLTTPHKDLS